MKYEWNPYTTHIKAVIDKMVEQGDFPPFNEWVKEFYQGREHMEEFYRNMHCQYYDGFLVSEYYAAARRRIEKLG